MIIIRKKVLITSFMVLCLVAVFGCGAFIYTNAADDKEIRIIIDAGHGAPDGGAVGVSGIVEKDINLAIASKLSEVLEAKGFTTIMTRMGDNGIWDSQSETLREKKRTDMQSRLNIMKNSGGDLFVSIHMNSFTDKSANGLHIFYSANHPKIKPLAEKVQKEISDITGASAHAVKSADESLFLMKSPPIPSILAECGFLSNPEEEKKLTDSEYQSRIAWAIAEAIDEYYTR